MMNKHLDSSFRRLSLHLSSKKHEQPFARVPDAHQMWCKWGISKDLRLPLLILSLHKDCDRPSEQVERYSLALSLSLSQGKPGRRLNIGGRGEPLLGCKQYSALPYLIKSE